MSNLNSEGIKNEERMKKTLLSLKLGTLAGSLCQKNVHKGISNLIYCFAGAISSPQRGTQCADLTKSLS